MRLNQVTFLVVTAVFLFSTPAVMADPKVMENYHYYIIEPKNSKDLPSALDRATPINENGRTFYGYTHWQVHWTFRFWTTTDGTCTLQQVNTTVNVDYTLPQLANTVNDEATLAAFQRYILALKEHEHGHAKNGMDAANEVESTLTGMSAASCPAAESMANEKGQGILRKYSQRDKDYDEQTQHGRTQGAVL